ncbi:MAG: Crp/Fnr family transcriptional regulator [Thiohalomonadales bacterium]
MDTDLLGEIPLFKVLGQEDRMLLASDFVLRKCPKNTIVINEGDDTDSLYIICQGRVKIYLNDEMGKQIILEIEGAGGYFGEIALLDEGPRSASVMTLEDCCFAVLRKKDFINYLADHPLLAVSIMRGLTRRLRVLTENARSLAFMDVYGRVARQLMTLASKRADGNWVIEDRLTLNDLANRIGASTKMVSRIMRDLRKGGYIRKESQQIVIEQNLPPAW